MEEPFSPLGIPDIQLLNKSVIDAFGGLYTSGDGNFHNRASLEHTLENILFPLFDEGRYPDKTDKMAALIHSIIIRHVFHDGNKRTALAVIEALASLNQYKPFIPAKGDEDFLVRIAEDSLSIEEISRWLKSRLQPSLR